MELSNVKLIVSARTQASRTAPLENISIEEPLTGNVGLRDFNARSMTSKRLKLGQLSFVNQSEGYVAQKIGKDEYRIKGHWVYGTEVANPTVFNGQIGYSVRIERPELTEAARPELRVVQASGEYAAA